mgnify:CR=1 FL=1
MKMNQKEKVIRHLQMYKSITPLEAFNEYGIMRLAAVIFDLKDMGFGIDSEMQKSLNRFGEKISYSKYTLDEQSKTV